MKTFFFALILIFLSSAIIPIAYAETIEKGKNFDREFLGYAEGNKATYKWTSYPERIVTGIEWSGKPIYSDYRLTETAASVFLETANSGSYHFDKNECAYNFYESGYIGTTQPKVKNISWNVKGKAATSNTWSSLPSINNADCVVSVITTESTVKLTGEKSTAQGTFQIVLDYAPGMGIKETMRGYNNNELWDNHNIGFTETFDVPQIIRFNSNAFDLSQYNGTILGRTWIQNNNAKLITLSDKVFYDFGIGFENLDNIRILWDGSQASLELNYLFANSIVPYQTWFEVDPTFSSDDPTIDGDIRNTSAGGCSATTTLTKQTSDPRLRVGVDSGNACRRAFVEWDISSIVAPIVVTDSDFGFDVNVTAGTPRVCGIYNLTGTRPTTASDADLWTAMGANAYLTGSATCETTGTKSIDLGGGADDDIENQVNNALGWFALAMKYDSEATDGADHVTLIDSENSASGSPPPTLTIIYLEGALPDAVDDLTAEAVTSVSVQLDWTEPGLNGEALEGYMINYSAGGGDPQTVAENNTETADTSYIVTGLTDAVNSFRVSAWTRAGVNASGNIATITGVSFAIGSINVTESNPDLLGIWFERDDLNDTASFVNVTYPNTYDLACNLSYVYAQINQTYTSLSNVTAPDNRVTSSFLFVDAGNDVVNMRCWDQITNDTGLYVLTQTDFLLLQQILDFRAGEFGTQGFIGVVDVVTVAVVILSMIGFNRLSESVGVIFNAVMIGVLGYFEFITFPGIFFGALGLVIMLAIYSTRKD